MKHLVVTGAKDSDIFLTSRFVSHRDKENKTVWKDKDNKIAAGKTMVDYAIVYYTGQTEFGHLITNRVYISASDIKSIYEAIQEVETITEGKEEDDFPF